jgi:Cys-rich protein (TIGR01571 family)
LQSPKSSYFPPPPTPAVHTSHAPPVEDLSAFHQPGQIMHPNQEVQGGTWTHSLCDCSSIGTCCLGLICPCILYGKTQHRLSMKSRKEDPTNMLGYDTCNGSCTAMTLFCGCQCKTSTTYRFSNHLADNDYRAPSYHSAHENEKSIWN